MKDEVIMLYFQGKSRNDIAGTCGLGQGTVSNIIDELTRSLGIPTVQSIRDLVVNLKRCGIYVISNYEGTEEYFNGIIQLLSIHQGNGITYFDILYYSHFILFVTEEFHSIHRSI